MQKQKRDKMELQPGLTAQESIIVSVNDCATQWGNDGLLAFSTPAMLGYMERTCVQALQPYLAGNMISVGTAVTLRHLAPTPISTRITISLVLAEVIGKRLKFNCEIYDQQEKIGEGTHERSLVESARFLETLQRKRQE